MRNQPYNAKPTSWLGEQSHELSKLNDPTKPRLDPAWKDLTRKITGGEFDHEMQLSWCLQRRLESVIDVNVQEFFILHIAATFHQSEPQMTRIIMVLSRVADILQKRPRIHMSSLLAKLIGQGIFYDGEGVTDYEPQRALRLLFATVGWLTNLYVPDFNKATEPFAILTENATCFEECQANAQLADRPLVDPQTPWRCASSSQFQRGRDNKPSLWATRRKPIKFQHIQCR